MTFNISALLSLKSELEYKFKKKQYEETSRAEEKSKYLTSIAFAELASFFDKVHKFNLESEISMIESDRTFADGVISKEYSFAGIKFSELLATVKAKQQAKIDEFISKKDEIEAKINSIKSKISEREATLTKLENQIVNIEQSVTQGSGTQNIAIIDTQIKQLQSDLEKNHTNTVEDLIKQQEVSKDIKTVAAEVVKEETQKVAVVVKESKTDGNKNVDTETQQLVFEFAKESKKACDETATTANVDEQKLESIKTIETTTQPTQTDQTNPQQLELPLNDQPATTPATTTPATTTPATTTPAATTPATTTPAATTETIPNNELLKQDETQKKQNEATEKAVDKIAKEAGINTNDVNKAVEDDKQIKAQQAQNPTTETTPPAQPETPRATTPAVATTVEEQNKQSIVESVEKVKKVNETTSEITENCDKKLANIQTELEKSHEKLKEAKEKTETSTDQTTPVNQPGTPLIPEQTQDKTIIMKEATENLKEAAQTQKEVLQAQKESVATLEESARKLIDEVALGNLAPISSSVQGEAKQSFTVEALKKMLEEAYKNLDTLMDSLTDAYSDKGSLKSISDTDLFEHVEDHEATSKNLIQADLKILKEQSRETENQLKKVKTEVFFITCEMNSVDKVLEKCKEIASNTKKIVVDKKLSDIYDKLSTELGKDKVVLDRRDTSNDRRANEDRRTQNTQSSEAKNIFGASKDEINELEKTKLFQHDSNEDKRASTDRRSTDRRQNNFVFSFDELDKVLKINNNKMA
ncbi:MAG: hypothetical protein AB1782_07975 [Cyanobacteriota bacterium]